jgi:hypothetical protein
MKGTRQAAPHPSEAPPVEVTTVSSDAPPSTRDADERHALIERAAYLIAESRGFAPGEELNDWLAAEAEVDRQLLHVAARPE